MSTLPPSNIFLRPPPFLVAFLLERFFVSRALSTRLLCSAKMLHGRGEMASSRETATAFATQAPFRGVRATTPAHVACSPVSERWLHTRYKLYRTATVVAVRTDVPPSRAIARSCSLQDRPIRSADATIAVAVSRARGAHSRQLLIFSKSILSISPPLAACHAI